MVLELRGEEGSIKEERSIQGNVLLNVDKCATMCTQENKSIKIKQFQKQ